MIHHVFATKSNIGDWLSARAIQSLLAPLTVVEHLCDEPFVPETLRRLRETREDDLIVIGGGGLFMDYFAPFWEGFREIGNRVPFCIWGVGFCDVKSGNSRASESLLREVVRAAGVCSVRDELTRTYLGVEMVQRPVPCPALSFVHTAAPGWGVLHADHYDVVGEGAYERVNRTVRAFAAESGRPLFETDNQIADGKEAELNRDLDRYAAADIVVSSRLHGCIIGLAMGRKVIAVSGDRKVESFMTAAGMSDWVIGAEGTEQLPNLLQAIDRQLAPAEFLEYARVENRRIAEQVRVLATTGRVLAATV